VAWYELDERGRGLDRVMAFSDGVFAIAITLLVLAFRLPIVHGARLDHKLVHSLLHEANVLIGFVVSFFVIARLWMTHHRLSLIMRRVDGRFIALNFVFLGLIVFLPFPTEVLGTYGSTTSGTVFYAVTLSVTLVLSASVWTYAIRAGLVDKHIPADTLRQVWLRSGFTAAVFLASVPVAIVAPGKAQLVWLALFVQHWILPRPDDVARRAAASD